MSLGPSLAELMSGFERYNQAIWPMQVIAYLLGIAALVLAVAGTKYSSRAVAAILSFYYLWIGIIFCLIFWRPDYAFASFLGVVFTIQAILFFVAGVLKTDLSFGFEADVYSGTGILFAAYAMLGFPLVASLIGHGYPWSPPFGLVPCPTTMFVFGMLLLTNKKVPKYVLVIPAGWALSAFVPAFNGLLEDIGLIIGGLLATAMIVCRDGRAAAIERLQASAAAP
jgi:hypothetical protein